MLCWDNCFFFLNIFILFSLFLFLFYFFPNRDLSLKGSSSCQKEYRSDPPARIRAAATAGPSVVPPPENLQREAKFSKTRKSEKKNHRFRCRPVLRCENSGPCFAAEKHRFHCRPVLRRKKTGQTGADVEQKLEIGEKSGTDGAYVCSEK